MPRVHTGNGEWRGIPFPAALRFQLENPDCASVGGKLHWLAAEGAEVCCFDVETEAFSAFSAPNPGSRRYRKLYAFEDRLCVAEDSTAWTVIWLRTGVAEWSKQFVIATKYHIRPRIGRQYFPIKVADRRRRGHPVGGWIQTSSPFSEKKEECPETNTGDEFVGNKKMVLVMLIITKI